MKKLLLVVLVALMTIGNGFAQRERLDPAARLQKEIDNLTTELSLSKEQVAQVTPIIGENQKKQGELFAKIREGGGNIDREQMRDERMKMRAETDQKLKAVLTPDQFLKLKAYRKKQMEERRAQGGPQL
jgi:periplasmic protein CpxP/Spy